MRAKRTGFISLLVLPGLVSVASGEPQGTPGITVEVVELDVTGPSPDGDLYFITNQPSVRLGLLLKDPSRGFVEMDHAKSRIALFEDSSGLDLRVEASHDPFGGMKRLSDDGRSALVTIHGSKPARGATWLRLRGTLALDMGPPSIASAEAPDVTFAAGTRVKAGTLDLTIVGSGKPNWNAQGVQLTGSTHSTFHIEHHAVDVGQGRKAGTAVTILIEGGFSSVKSVSFIDAAGVEIPSRIQSSSELPGRIAMDVFLDGVVGRATVKVGFLAPGGSVQLPFDLTARLGL